MYIYVIIMIWIIKNFFLLKYYVFYFLLFFGSVGWNIKIVGIGDMKCGWDVIFGWWWDIFVLYRIDGGF